MNGHNCVGIASAVDAPQIPKHETLANSISNLDSLISHAESALAKITGNDDALRDSKGEMNTPTLSDVLNGGAPQVDSVINQVHDLLGAIEHELF